MICALPAQWQAHYGNYIGGQTAMLLARLARKLADRNCVGTPERKKKRKKKKLGVIRRIRGYTIKMNLA